MLLFTGAFFGDLKDVTHSTIFMVQLKKITCIVDARASGYTYLTMFLEVDALIRVRDLQKNYGDKIALQGISFDVKEGEVFGFLGPNGAGKTTTIKILTGQMPPSSGEAAIMGKNPFNSGELSMHIGVVPENTNLYERLTVEQNLQFFCRLYGCDTRNIDFFLEQVQLQNEKRTIVKKLSKGLKQRVLLIRALLHNPKLLFLDEPTAGLDPASADRIHKLIIHLNQQGATVFLTSHNMEEVEKLCNRVAFLDQGRIVEMGKPADLKLRYSKGNAKVLLINENNELYEEMIDLHGSESAQILAKWIEEGLVKSIHSNEPTLADIFVEVTGRELS